MKIKKILLKKSTWVILALFVVAAIVLPNLKPKADTNVNMKILELESGNNFILNDSVDGVEVTKMTIAQFNSMRDEVFGKYDTIVIGRANQGLSQKFSENSAYRDYSSDFSQQIGDVELSNNNEGAQFCKKLWYTQSNAFAETRNNLKDNGFEFKGNTFVEYYSGNDITNLRAKEVLKMVDNNQLVYIDDSILNDSSLADSRLVANFGNKEGLNHFSNGDLSVKEIYDAFLAKNIEDRRPVIDLVSVPASDDKTADKGDVNNREMKVTFNLDGGDNCTAKLYLDYNCDGLYSEKESTDKIYKLSQCKNDDGSYTVLHDLDTTFVGYLQWKLAITNSKGIKSYVTGAAQYRDINGNKRKISVLQIYPDNCEKAIMFSDSKLINKLDKVVDYEFVISTISNTDFNAKAGTSIGIDSYDMLVIGLADSYGGSNDFSPNAIALVQEYCDTGKSVMFTHDTMSLNEFATTEWDHKTGPAMLTAQFRDQIGQAIYEDPFSTHNNKDENGQVLDFISYTDENGNVIKDTIPHRDVASNTRVQKDFPNAQNIVSMGTTLYARHANNGEEAPAKNGWTKTLSTKVKEINNASITNFPYELDTKITVAKTHTQWWQLNLEDEDIVPMYNLSNGAFDDGDSQNFYYTYNKGNITYSGTGHSSVNDDSELELFVNTIVRAVRGANNPPIITNYNNNKEAEIAEASVETVDQYEDYNFVTVPTDIDQDKINVAVTLDGNTVFTKDRVLSGTDLEVKIDASYFENYDEDTVGTITVNATDTQGNNSSKSFNIKINPVPKDFAVYHGIYNSKDIKEFDALTNDSVYSDSKVSTSSPYDNNYFEEFGFVGTACVNCKEGTIEVAADENFKNAQDNSYFIGDVNVYALAGNKLKLLGKATVDGNKATYAFTKSDVEGVAGKLDKTYKLVVTYKCKAYNKVEGSELKYTNNIKVYSNDYSRARDISIRVQNDVKDWELF